MQHGGSGTNFTKKGGQRLPTITDKGTCQKSAQKNNNLIFYVAVMIHICDIYLENNLISAFYFTFINRSVTLVNNYKT